MLKTKKVQTKEKVRPFYEEVLMKEIYSYCIFFLFIISEENHGLSLCDFPLLVFLIAPNLQPHRAVPLAHR